MEDALRLAQEADLDLVEVAPDARPPVCKLMDYGKFKYEADMKAREARRNQANTVLKEIRFRLKIDPHDYGTKKGHVERFLKAGDKVKVMIMFRGREQSRPEMGVRLLQRLADDVAEFGTVESLPRQDGRNMIMVLGPTKRKVDVKNELRRKAREAEEAGKGTDAAAEPLEADAVEVESFETESVETAAVETAAAETTVETVAETVETPAAEVEVDEVPEAPVVEPEPTPAPEPAPAPVAKAAPAPRASSAAPAPAAPRATSPAPTPAPRPAGAAPKPAAPRATGATPTPKPAPRPRAPKS